MALLLITALFTAILIWVTWGFIRSRDPLLRHVMLVFGSVAMLFVLAVIRLLVGEPPLAVAGLFAAVLLGQPFLTLRLVSKLRPVPVWALWGAAGAWLLTSIPVVLLERPLPRPVTWPIVVAFFLVESAAAWLLALEARRRGGAAGIRLWCAAGGTAMFGVALLITAGGPAVTALSRGMATMSALMYLLAFAPPRWLRRTWSRRAANTMMGRLLAAPATDPPECTWRRYCDCAREVLGADGVMVLLETTPGTVEQTARSGLTAPHGRTLGREEIGELLAMPRTVDLRATRSSALTVAADVATGSGARFVTATPLAVPERGGVLVVLNRHRTLFADDDIALFTELAVQAAAMADRAALSLESQRLAVIVESSHDAIVGKTLDGVITSWNAGAQRLYGHEAAEVIGQHASLLFPPGQEETQAALLARIAGGERIDQYEVQRRRKGGGTVTVALTLSPITEPGGRVVGVASISRDITERLEAEAERERSAARAAHDAAERGVQHTRRLESLGQLAGGVAHDFNNILAVIGSYSELSIETLDSSAPTRNELVGVRADLIQISRAAERATRLTKQLLAFGRRDITHAEVLCLNDLIREVEQLLRRAIGEHITLLTDLNPDLWHVQADPSQIEQILLNLAVNARDAMPGGGTLSMDTANTALDEDDSVVNPALAPGRYVRVRVSDTGAGMAPEVVDRAFEPFYTTKPQGTGTGLGLATVYGIAAAAGGTVQLFSQPGVGTTITILLPTTEATVATESSNSDGDGAPERSQGYETILLVEDEAPLRDITTRILARAGYHVLTADGGPTAIAVAHQHPGPIDLLLTDVIMPKMMGNEVAERITAIRPETRVLYMSGYAQPVLTEHGTLQPGVTLVEKPFTRRHLLHRVGGVLHGNSGARDSDATQAERPPMGNHPHPVGIRPDADLSDPEVPSER